MSKVLVTGGAGFIGSCMVGKLIERGDQVTVIDNLSSGRKENINPKAEFIQGDLKDKEFVLENIKNFDWVYHLAANPDVRLGEQDKRVHIQENIIVTHNILEAMRLNKLDKIVFTSTSAVYGEAREIPTPEDYGPLITISLYAASKLAAESIIYSYSEFGIRSWVLRLANIIGGRSDHGVIPDFVKKLEKNPEELEVLGDGKQTKSYLHVDDCTDAMLFATENAGDKINIFNIGSPDTVTVKEIAELVIERKSPGASIRYTGGKQGWRGDVTKFLLSIEKLKKLGWVPQSTSRDSVIKTIEQILAKNENKQI
ncbi:MAG: NAD-dependent epimerase/dehydratase family protein [archaeon]|nr:MAG: NAD-dependent epimerase/dehydratase family protein [archaeon]